MEDIVTASAANPALATELANVQKCLGPCKGDLVCQKNCGTTILVSATV